ncbi:MAG: ABC transporter ATP-binding protein [Saprospiraceae bacterium]|nr:ABC transporter ATP-binding protein [Saprospiraceae bacterium]
MLLDIKNLNVAFSTERGIVPAVRNLNLQLKAGQTLGLVGESGSGKSVTALSILQLLPSNARATGAIYMGEENPINLIGLPEAQLSRMRGGELAMIYQEPMTALNPVFRCGRQVTEALQIHQNISAAEARAATLSLFEKVKLPDPARIFEAFPHELSGGQKQRILIAMALSGRPKVLIADEPTTALDVTVQRAILDLMLDLREEYGLSMLFISHDLGVISEIADTVAVMKSGEIVESGPAEQVLSAPVHPYTRGLVACRPSLHKKLRRLPTIQDFESGLAFSKQEIGADETRERQAILYQQTPVLQVQDLCVQFPARKNWLGLPSAWHNAVDQVSFELFPGEIFGIAGESGCGKTTLGRAICRLVKAQRGTVHYRGVDLLALSEQAFRPFRQDIQLAFQDPYSSLNPRMTIGDALLEPLQTHNLYDSERQQKQRVLELLETVGLEADHARRYPSEFSGGQRQRICLARALAVQPKLLICDEVVSALDVSVQATVLNLLLDLREKFGLTYIFISHDLSVLQQMCDRLLVMEQGKIVDIGFPRTLFEQSEKAYVRTLLASVPGQQYT